MATYTYPPMPLLANVWLAPTTLPPTGPPDLVEIPCSLSPVKPAEFQAADGNYEGAYLASHIIRTAPNEGFSDNHIFAGSPPQAPSTVFEIPARSGHLYVAVFAHQVGAGFNNHHARIFAARYSRGTEADLPFFRGWI